MMWCFPKESDVERTRVTEDLLQKQRELENENKVLREKLEKANHEWSTNIDAFVEQWYNENRDEIDIGVIDLRFFKIDLMPDYLEKHIYKKVLKIVFSFLNSSLSPKIPQDED